MHFAARLHVILILVMTLSHVVMTQAVPATNTQLATLSSTVPNVTTHIIPATDTQPATPSATVEDTAKHDQPLYDKTSVIWFAGFFLLADLIIVVNLCFVWLEGRDTRGAEDETRNPREVVEELELTDRLTWGRS